MMKYSLFFPLLFTGCFWHVKPHIEYVDRPVKVYVPQKCKVPAVKCNFNKETDTEVIASLLECIKKQKQAVKVCQ